MKIIFAILIRREKIHYFTTLRITQVKLCERRTILNVNAGTLNTARQQKKKKNFITDTIPSDSYVK